MALQAELVQSTTLQDPKLWNNNGSGHTMKNWRWRDDRSNKLREELTTLKTVQRGIKFLAGRFEVPPPDVRRPDTSWIPGLTWFQVWHPWEVDPDVVDGCWNDTPRWCCTSKLLGKYKSRLCPLWEKRCYLLHYSMLNPWNLENFASYSRAQQFPGNLARRSPIIGPRLD